MAAPPDFSDPDLIQSVDPSALQSVPEPAAVTPPIQIPAPKPANTEIVGFDADKGVIEHKPRGRGKRERTFRVPITAASPELRAAAEEQLGVSIPTAPQRPTGPTGGRAAAQKRVAERAAEQESEVKEADGTVPGVDEFIDPGRVQQLSPAAAQIQALQALPPGTVIGGSPGTLQQVAGPTQTTTPTLGPGEEEAEAEFVAAITQQALLQEDRIQREAEALQDQAITETLKADVRAEAAQRETERETERQAAVATRLAEFDEVKSQAINTNIDPGSFWARRDTGANIATALGVLIGGFSQGLTGRENPGLVMLQKAMDRDMQAQIKNADNRFRGTGLSLKGIELVNGMFDKESDRALAIQEMNLTALDQEMAARMAKAKNPSVIEALANNRSQIRVQIATLRQQLAQSLRGQQTTTTQVRRVGGTRGVTREEALEQARGVTGTEGFDRDRFVRDLGGNAQTKEEGVKIREELKTIKNIEGSVRRLKQLKEKGDKLSPSERKAADAIVQSLSLDLAVYKNLGAISETDKGFVEGLTSGGENPLSFANFEGGRVRELEGTLNRSKRILRGSVIPVDFIPEAFRGDAPGAGPSAGQQAQQAARKF